ncbi:hypothetical protein BDZ91DRAFT_715807 [Kalaharituber pfeilii]|nr:hypothetical protein BDZ91DRAFT_715807 [Kalaharituber pfeilii]
MSGRVKNLLLGKKDPSAQKHSDENFQGKKRYKDINELPQSPRSPISPGFLMQPLRDHLPPLSTSPHPPRTSSSQKSVASSTMNPQSTVSPFITNSGRRIDTEPTIAEEKPSREVTGGKSQTSEKSSIFKTRHGADTPPESTRPSPSRSSSQDGKEGNFMNRVKASRQAAQTYGGKAAKITAKATSTTAKALGEKGSKAWDKIKTKAKSNREPQHIVPQSQYLSNFKPRKAKKPPIDVWGMSLKDATLRTRVINEMSSEADSAAYWTPAVAFRCLQYLNVHGPQELGLYRVSGSTAVVDEMKADFINRHDVDISLNPPNDIHTVTSLLKGYFRALPDAILPAEIQKKVYEQCKDLPDKELPPQCFLDELSQLPPYNYYMLYSLSAHLSNVNRLSDVNKMNLSNLGMIFCSTLRIDRFCFNWLVGHWAECWQGCWTEKGELERTDPEQYKRHMESLSARNSPAATFDTHSSAPSSPAPYSTAPHTPVQPSLRSQQTPAQSPHIAQSPLSNNSQSVGCANSPVFKRTALTVGSQTGTQSVPPTPRSPRSPREPPTSVPTPTTPYTPASFTMGDDKRMMVHSTSDIIADYAHDDEAEAEPAKIPSNPRTMIEKNEAVTVNEIEPFRIEKQAVTKQQTSQQPELKLEGVAIERSPSIGHSPRADSPKSRPPNIRVPPPTHADSPKSSTLPVGLQLMLPPLTPMSPLIATMDHSSSS